MAEQGYIGSSRDGWLNVKRAAGGAIIALPQYLRVEILSEQDGRTQFRVAEGVEAGATFTAKSGHLARGNPGYRGAARMRSRSLTFRTHCPPATWGGRPTR